MLRGAIKLMKRVRKNPVWSRDPKCYAGAWADLLLLANDAPRTVHIHGEAFPLQRGQLAWSIQSLEQEWNRSAEWIKRFLMFCQDETMLKADITRRRTIITILNYDVYNPPETDSVSEPETDSVSEPETDSVSEPEQKGEGGRGNREIGSGKVEPRIRATKPVEGILGRDLKKNASENGGGHRPAATSPAQALFLIDRELAEVNGEIEELDELCKPVPKDLRARRRDLEKKRAKILTTHKHE